MFDKLNTPTPNANTDKAVDDIFAETEAPSINNMSNSGNNIETQPAGLASRQYAEDDNSQGSGGGFKVKKLIIIFLALLIIAALAYLVYAKFLNVPSTIDETQMINNGVVTDNVSDPKETPPVNNGDFIEPNIDNTNIVSPNNMTDGVVNPGDVVAPVEPIEPVVPVVVAPVDSDADSLTDPEEIALGTNINLIDSDFDGLSDYEEVRVYGTNPLNPDTDGDGYKDDEEVKGGYNPNGEGILQ